MEELSQKAVHETFSAVDQPHFEIHSVDWITESLFRDAKCGQDDFVVRPAVSTTAPFPLGHDRSSSQDLNKSNSWGNIQRSPTASLQRINSNVSPVASLRDLRRKSLSPPSSAAALKIKQEQSVIERQLSRSSSSGFSRSASGSGLLKAVVPRKRPLIVDDEGDDDEDTNILDGVHDAQNPSKFDERALELNDVAPIVVDPFDDLLDEDDRNSDEEERIAQAFASDETKMIYSTKIVPITSNKRRKIAEATEADSKDHVFFGEPQQDAAARVVVQVSMGDYSMPFFKDEGRSRPEHHSQYVSPSASRHSSKEDSGLDSKKKLLLLSYDLDEGELPQRKRRPRADPTQPQAEELSPEDYMKYIHFGTVKMEDSTEGVKEEALEDTEVLPKIPPPMMRAPPPKRDPFEDENERSWYMPLLGTNQSQIGEEESKYYDASLDLLALQQGHDSSDDDYASDSHEGDSDDDKRTSRRRKRSNNSSGGDTSFGHSSDASERKKRLAHYARFEGANFREFIPEPTEAQSKRIERRRATFACQKGPAKEGPGGPEATLTNAGHQNLNKHITEVLEKLEETCKNSGDQWRAYAYRRAVQVLKARREKITNAEQARKLRGIGSKIADKIAEILSTGTLRKVQLEENDEMLRTYRLFGKVFGAGPSTIRKWFALGYRTLDDLRNKASLSAQQQIGLNYYDEFQQRIPRAEVQMIASLIIAHIQNVDPDFIAEVCGSYRRGKADCGDMDILVTHPREKKLHGLLEKLVPLLHQANILTDDLTGVKSGLQDKYMGVCWTGLPNAVHRRIDIQVVPLVEWPFALLYFTGSGYFNRSMRLWAQRHGFSLSEHALVRRYGKPNSPDQIKGDPIPGLRTEKDIFDALGLEYKAPHERDV